MRGDSPRMPRPVRLAVRALILHRNQLLLVNAYGGGVSDLWCAPGGGVNPHQSLHDNLIREVHEETGLRVAVGDLALVNEFHDPARDFHQVEMFFRCTIVQGSIDARWRDPEGIVTQRRYFDRTALETGAIRFKPDSLPAAAWGSGAIYDRLEPIVI